MNFLDTMRNVPSGIKAVTRMKKMQKELSRERLEINENGVRIVMGGDQMVKELEIDGTQNKKVIDALNKAIKKTMELSAKKMQEMSGLDPMSMLKGLN